MDTSLQTDTIQGVQPTLMGKYMMDTSQVPTPKNCDSRGFNLTSPGLHCDVRYLKKHTIDAESVLLGLDRKITKQEPLAPIVLDEPKIELSNVEMQTSMQAFEAIGTRTKRGCGTLSGITINRFEQPFQNPQELSTIEMKEMYRGGMQTRMYAKDCSINTCGKTMKLKPEYGNRCPQ